MDFTLLISIGLLVLNLSLLVLVVLLLSVLRVLCLSLMVALIYSGAVLITFIFVVMTFDQSDILCIPSYKFIPLLVLYIEGFIPHDGQ